MKFVIGLALIILSVSSIWAEETTIKTINETVATTTDITEIGKGKCSYFCAFKTMFLDADGIGRDFVKLLLLYDDETEIDGAFEACNHSSTENDDSCEKYFDCVETEFQNKNISFLFDMKN